MDPVLAGNQPDSSRAKYQIPPGGEVYSKIERQMEIIYLYIT